MERPALPCAQPSPPSLLGDPRGWGLCPAAQPDSPSSGWGATAFLKTGRRQCRVVLLQGELTRESSSGYKNCSQWETESQGAPLLLTAYRLLLPSFTGWAGMKILGEIVTALALATGLSGSPWGSHALTEISVCFGRARAQQQLWGCVTPFVYLERWT